MTGNRLLVIGGGTWQIPIVKEAKKMGLYVACSNLYEDSPAFPYVDECYVCDVLDVEKNYQFACDFKPDAIITDQTDIAVPTVAKLCDRLGLPSISEKKAKLFTNKYQMCEFAEKAGFSVPAFTRCSKPQDAFDLLHRFGKIIIKPVDSQSSRGVVTISSEEELIKNYNSTLSFSNFDVSVLAEQYIDGTEFTVDGLKDSAGFHVLAISEKTHFANQPNVANELVFSNKNINFDYDEIRRTNGELIQTMGLTFGLTHTEYKYFNGEYYLIETSARGGGTRISSDIVPFMSGVNSNRALIQLALGETVVIKENFDESKFATLWFPCIKPGFVSHIAGVEEIRALPGIIEFDIGIEDGQEIFPICDDRSRQAYCIIMGDSPDFINERKKKIADLLKITYY